MAQLGGAQCNSSALHYIVLLSYWGGLLRCFLVSMSMGGRSENGATQLPSLFSWISSRAPVLCLQLSPTPRFFTLRDQAPGSTSLPSFVSDGAVLPGPLLVKDCSFDLFRPSAGGSHRPMAECRLHPGTLAGPCCCRCPETAASCQPAPEKVHETM